MSPEQSRPLSTELRLALAMRGGVSLAVWMGGSCCEVAALRKKDGVYGELLERCGFEDVTVDVLAGTSAGGLNGVLFACHLLYGMPFDAGVRNVWLELGDLESLLRPTPRLGRLPDSLLRGDETFYARLRDELNALIAKGEPPAEPPAALRLILTATRLQPRPDWVRPTLGQSLLTGRSRAYFRFRHRSAAGAAAPSLTDFPAGGDERAEALNRLAYAARATSSFPGAFEPARPVVGVPPAGATAPPTPPNLWGVSSETGHPDPAADGTVELVDGGLLDNIPVAWAVRAIAGSPADRGVDRWLLFLQPVPPYPPEPVAKEGRQGVTRLLRLAVRSLGIKTGTESLLDDVAEFRAAEDVMERHRGLAGVLPARPAWCEEAATAQWPAYVRRAGDAEARRVSRLLQDPTEVTGPDPLPLPPGPGPLDGLDACLPEGSAPFVAELRKAGEHWVLPAEAPFQDLPLIGRSPLPLARAVRLLLDWLRAFEAGASESAAGLPPSLPELRKRLYAHRLAIATLVAARDRTILREFTAGLAGGTHDPLELMRRAVVRLELVLPAPRQTDGDWEIWAADLAAVATTDPGAACAGSAERASVSYQTVYTSLFASLAALGRDMGLAMAAGAGTGDHVPVRGFQALHEAAAGASGDMARVLAAAEVLLGPLRPDPLAEPTGIKFHTVSAANTSWATEYTPPGEAAHEAEEPAPGGAGESALGGAEEPAPGRRETSALQSLVEGKLSGNQLNNFSAFLSARWRLSDWTWGRLDAAASLVRIVATDERLRAEFGDPCDDKLIGTVAAHLAPSLDWLPDQLYGTARPRDATPQAALEDLWRDTPPGQEPWDRLRHLLIELRQREILKEELPVIAALIEQPGQGNPPAVPTRTPPVDFDTAFKEFRRVGAESVPELLQARDPRRAAVRLGLLVWPALQPSGHGWQAAARLGLGLLKPLVWLPVVLAVFAPALAALALSLLWVGVAFSADRCFSPPGHIILAVFFVPALALGFGIWLRGTRPPPRWRRVRGWLAMGLLCVTVLASIVCAVCDASPSRWTGGASDLTRQFIVGGTMLAAAGALLRVVSNGRGHSSAMAAVAVAAGVVAFLLQTQAAGKGAWWAVLVLYAVLVMVQAALNWLRPGARA
ncbi:DUF3376 domain-containing protein [Streptomyces aurantiacus]|uniref:PNPLA domain-containing protein n=1 Tax=Streptomyces aurantiacus JA 4570 TaxID=1286094 RepID=S3ZW09_9ACTN|nr:DUF3376 domain-containing protein [Streptomyces aurantiacus]EPH42575.1 hypothetical protein STRAU_4339 [Streptomyces aurantiacus JA 4570]